jgi:hypothetical protein
MAPKVRNVTPAAFADDTFSDLPPPPPPASSRALKRTLGADDAARKLEAQKRAKTSSGVRTTGAGGKSASVEHKISEVERAVLAAEKATMPEGRGKTRFFREFVGLRQRMVDGKLLGFGPVILGSKPGDYDRMRVYSGSSSSEDTNASREETYRVARSLGLASDSSLLSGVNYREVGVLPPPGDASQRYQELCDKAFRMPEAERDLLTVDRSFLSSAMDVHLVNVSAFSVWVCRLFLFPPVS